MKIDREINCVIDRQKERLQNIDRYLHIFQIDSKSEKWMKRQIDR